MRKPFRLIKSLFLALLRQSPLPSTVLGPPKESVSVDRSFESQSKGSLVYRLSEKVQRTRKAPQTLGEFQPALDVQYPETFVAVFAKGRVFSESGTVINRDDHIVEELSRETYTKRADRLPVSRKLKLPRLKKIEGEVINLAAPGGRGYYHLLTDVLPRLQLVREAGIEWEKVDAFYVSRTSRFYREAFAQLGIPERKLVSAQEFPHIQAERLIAPSFVSDIAQTPPWVVDFHRKTFSKAKSRNRRLYLSRGENRRGIENEHVLSDLLEEFGFETFDLGRLSFQKQVELLSSAEVVMGPHGGALANCVFAAPGTKVIEIFPPDFQSTCFWSLCEAGNMEHVSLSGTPGSVGHFRVETTLVRQALELAGVSKGRAAA